MAFVSSAQQGRREGAAARADHVQLVDHERREIDARVLGVRCS